MKTKLLTAAALCIPLTACTAAESQESKMIPEELQSSSGTDIIFEEPPAETSPAGMVAPLESVDAEITSGPDYSYSGEPVKISYAYTINGDAPGFGLMVLCDGIATPFSLAPHAEQSLLQVVPYDTPGEIRNVDLYFEPIGQKGDTVSIQIVDIMDPEYDIDSIDVESENAFQPLIIGGRFQIASLSGLYVTMQQDGLPADQLVSMDFETEVIPEDIIQNNQSVCDDGTIDNQLRFLNSYQTRQLYKVVHRGEVLPLDTKLSGTEGQSLYVSFYLDHQLTPVWNGCSYLKCYVDDTHYTQIHGELDTSQLETGRYLCYTVCGNSEYNNCTAPIRAFILDVV